MPATAGQIAKVLKTEIARIQVTYSIQQHGHFQGNQQQQTTLQMRGKHNWNDSNSRDASNSKAATDKTFATYEF
jgi:hypothetical protein